MRIGRGRRKRDLGEVREKELWEEDKKTFGRKEEKRDLGRGGEKEGLWRRRKKKV